ncbi:MAG: carbon-nitrogen hydrolase family protein [Dehalococcoidia bacterium]|nr:carbon-nitrogen hydrolase family protein [Dehalococcoidia bacterium]
MNTGPTAEGPGTGINSGKSRGFRIADVAFSTNEACPSFMTANINPKFDIEHNLSRMEEIAQAAHEKQVDILILPELAVSGYVWDNDDRGEVLEHLKASDNRRTQVKRVLDRIKAGLVDSCRGLKAVFFGNVRDNRRGSLHDTVFIMTATADYNTVFYDKIFLTPLEKLYFKRGSDQRLVLDTRWGRIGVMICYDMCFVGLGKRYAFNDEVDLIITAAAWRTEAYREYPLLNLKLDNYYQFIWNLMHSALAAHNQIWSIGANCVGAFEKTGGLFCGQSGIWSPSGIPLVQASHDREELLILRNVEIRGHMRHQAKEDFDYSLDFDEVYREIKDLKPRHVSLHSAAEWARHCSRTSHIPAEDYIE